MKRAKIFKSALKVVTAFIIVLILIISAGFLYTWYVGKNTKIDDSFKIETTENDKQNNFITPTKPAPDANVGVAIYVLSSPVKPGDGASITIKTNAEAKCVIDVFYDEKKTIKDDDKSLIDKIADEYGIASWEWTVDNNVSEGKWPVEVTCSNAVKSGYVKGDLVVKY